MAPPVRQSQSWTGPPAVAPGMKIPEVLASSDTMAPSGSRAPMAALADSAVRTPVGRSGRKAAWTTAPSAGAPRISAKASRAPGASSPGGGQDMDLAPVGDQVAGDVRIGEERHRGARHRPGSGAGPLSVGPG